MDDGSVGQAVGDELLKLGSNLAASGQKDNVTSAALNHALSHGTTKTTSTTNDDVGGIALEEVVAGGGVGGLDLARHLMVDDNLTGGLTTLELTQSRLDLGDFDSGDGTNGKHNLLVKEIHDSLEGAAHDLGALSSDESQVDRAERAVVLKLAHLQTSVGNDITLTNLDEATERSKALPGLAEKVTSQRVDDNVNTLATSSLANLSTEASVTRVENAVGRDAVGVNEKLLLLDTTDGGVDLSTDHLGELDGSLTNTTSTGVDENLVTRLDAGEVNDTVVSSAVDDGDRGSSREAHIVRDDSSTGGRAASVGAVRTESHGADTVADLEAGDVGTDGSDGTRAFNTNVRRGNLSHGDDDILEVHTSCSDLDLNVISGQRKNGLVLPVEGVESTVGADGNLEAAALLVEVLEVRLRRLSLTEQSEVHVFLLGDTGNNESALLLSELEVDWRTILRSGKRSLESADDQLSAVSRLQLRLGVKVESSSDLAGLRTDSSEKTLSNVVDGVLSEPVGASADPKDGRSVEEQLLGSSKGLGTHLVEDGAVELRENNVAGVGIRLEGLEGSVLGLVTTSAELNQISKSLSNGVGFTTGSDEDDGGLAQVNSGNLLSDSLDLSMAVAILELGDILDNVSVTVRGVSIAVSMSVAVGVSVSIGMTVTVGVSVAVSMAITVSVAVAVGNLGDSVTIGAVGMSIAVNVAITVGVAVTIRMSVAVGMSVTIGVAVTVSVTVGVTVGLTVGNTVLLDRLLLDFGLLVKRLPVDLVAKVASSLALKDIAVDRSHAETSDLDNGLLSGVGVPSVNEEVDGAAADEVGLAVSDNLDSLASLVGDTRANLNLLDGRRHEERRHLTATSTENGEGKLEEQIAEGSR